MMPFRSSDGISEGEMYRERMLKASSAKGRSFQLSQFAAEGISSGMYRPPSVARPLRTTSSNDSCERESQTVSQELLGRGGVRGSKGAGGWRISYIAVLAARAQIPLRRRVAAIGSAGRWFAVRHGAT